MIVLCRHTKHAAWLLFILAHELGHLALDHVPNEGVLIDEGLDKNSTDAEEQQANAFAIELLTGRPIANSLHLVDGRNATRAEAPRCKLGANPWLTPVTLP